MEDTDIDPGLRAWLTKQDMVTVTVRLFLQPAVGTEDLSVDVIESDIGLDVREAHRRHMDRFRRVQLAKYGWTLDTLKTLGSLRPDPSAIPVSNAVVVATTVRNLREIVKMPYVLRAEVMDGGLIL